MAWLLVETYSLLAVIIFLLYYYSKSKLKYWEKRGVKGPKPIVFCGNFLDVFLARESVTDCIGRAYNEYKHESLIGVFSGHIPLLLVTNPELMKDVLIKDFTKFADRTIGPMRETEPLSEHLFRLEEKRWRPLRAKLSPVFSSGKLKEMFHLIVECANHLEKYLDGLVRTGEPIDCREISAKYTTDTIGSCAFGIEMNALASESSEFRTMGKRVFQPTWRTFVRDRVRDYPLLFKLLAPCLIDRELLTFFTSITAETVDHRIKHKIRRHDFMDALVDLKQNPGKLGLEEMDDLYMTSQVFVFFVAGFETSSVTMMNTLYELAINPSVQEKLRAEIQDVLQKTNGEITYDCLQEMKYLDACFKETLRKYPVVLWLSRKAMDDYTFSGTKVTISKGQQVLLPVFAIQRDPKIYPNPDVYDPNRFLEEGANSRHAMYFLPFGDGPRNCIGARFAKIQSKVGMIKVLSKYKLEVCEKTCKEYVIDKKQLFLLQPSHNVYVKMTPLAS